MRTFGRLVLFKVQTETSTQAAPIICLLLFLFWLAYALVRRNSQLPLPVLRLGAPVFAAAARSRPHSSVPTTSRASATSLSTSRWLRVSTRCECFRYLTRRASRRHAGALRRMRASAQVPCNVAVSAVRRHDVRFGQRPEQDVAIALSPHRAFCVIAHSSAPLRVPSAARLTVTRVCYASALQACSVFEIISASLFCARALPLSYVGYESLDCGGIYGWAIACGSISLIISVALLVFVKVRPALTAVPQPRMSHARCVHCASRIELAAPVRRVWPRDFGQCLGD